MDYELIDSGEGRKLERFGQTVLSRPDPQAIWKCRLPRERWQKADAVFADGKWDKKLPDWNIKIGNLTFKISLSSFKHTGVFPEHISNWEWIEEKLKSGSKLKVLNLFGYTGGATLSAAGAGAEVTHLDASKLSVNRAGENAALSDLGEAPIRWIVDDAKDFVKREVKRGNKYDGIILDPPSFGRGSKGQVWKIEEDLLPLLETCREVLSPDFKFILLNGYVSGYSHRSYAQTLSSVFGLSFGEVESGELYIKENSERGFVLPAGIFARWSRKQ